MMQVEESVDPLRDIEIVNEELIAKVFLFMSVFVSPFCLLSCYCLCLSACVHPCLMNVRVWQDIELVDFGLSKLEYIVTRGSAGREPQYEYDTLRKAYRVLSGREYVPKKTRPAYSRASSSAGGEGGGKGASPLRSKTTSSVEVREDEDEDEVSEPGVGGGAGIIEEVCMVLPDRIC